MTGHRRGGGQLRIIGGRHRGRRLPVTDHQGLRPTTDRVRETLFNWLQPVITGARCLDLFAGSGALGLEAASRGAARVVLLERAAAVVRQLSRNAETLGEDRIEVVHTDALRWLEHVGQPFDVVFVDPPFADGLLEPACRSLERHQWLAPGALVYLEWSARLPLPTLPAGWELIRNKQAGEACYGLAQPRSLSGNRLNLRSAMLAPSRLVRSALRRG